jgi:hypothetical protein
VTEQQQSDYTVQAYQIMRNSGEVAAAYCFFWKSGDTWAYDWVRPDGTLRPVVSAVQSLVAGS